jgi:hypothetical protein
MQAEKKKKLQELDKELRDCGGYILGYPHGYTWAAPSEVAWPTRSRRAPQGYKVY